LLAVSALLAEAAVLTATASLIHADGVFATGAWFHRVGAIADCMAVDAGSGSQVQGFCFLTFSLDVVKREFQTFSSVGAGCSALVVPKLFQNCPVILDKPFNFRVVNPGTSYRRTG
jgi:hypothetical protein